ncbi:MAG: copper-binding protein [Pseudomonadota bacterium]
MNKPIAMIAASLLLAGSAVYAGGDHGHGGHGTAHGGGPKADATAAAKIEQIEGEVRKVDTDAKKITIKHGEIKSLQMPGMTMVFQVKDPALLGKTKAGDKIVFSAEKTGGAFVVTDIQPAK